MTEALHNMRLKARDNARTPCQWDSSKNAGFTTGTPWMKIHDDYTAWNAANQVADPNSIWTFWQALLKLRSTNLCLVYGSFHHVQQDHLQVFVS